MWTEVEIKRKAGCGMALLGKNFVGSRADFREDSDTHVEYLFFTLFFLPVWPLGCYRVKNTLNKQYSGTPGEQYLHREKPKTGEIVRIYIDRWFVSPLLAIIAILSLLHGIYAD